MTVELVVTVKDEARTLKKEFLVYDPISFIEDDPVILQCVNEVIEEFKGDPETIKVRAMMVMR